MGKNPKGGQQRAEVYNEPKKKKKKNKADNGQGRPGPKNKEKISPVEWLLDQQIKANWRVSCVVTHEGA
jgi:hypothetical protein